MPVNPTYPGVYIQELPSGSRAIAGVATSVAAIIGTFARGPADAAVQVFNMGDVERHFGGFLLNRDAPYAVQQFFLNGGTEAWIVRVAPGGVAASATLRGQGGGGPTPVLRATAGRRIKDAAVVDPGAWGNSIRIDVDYETADPATQFNLSITETRDDNGREAVARSETFRNLIIDPARPNDALAVVNDGSRIVQLDRTAGWDTARPATTGTLSGAIDPSLAGLTNVNSDVRITITRTAGAQQEILSVAAANLPTTPGAARVLLETLIRNARPSEPFWAQASVKLINNQLRILGGRIGTDYDAEAVITFQDVAGNLAATLQLLAPNVRANVQQYRLGSPNAAAIAFRDVVTVGVNDTGPTSAALRGNRGVKTGLYALENVDLFNMLLIPEASTIDTAGSVTNLTQVMSAAQSYAEERRAFVLMDVQPSIDTMEEAREWMNRIAAAGLRHRNAAVYFPRTKIADPLQDNRLRAIGASGTMAGIYARTDGARGLWKAPAGIESSLRGVAELETRLTDPENGQLNPIGLNCLRTFDNVGTVAWGARTLLGADVFASDWKYVPVRRLALYVEESLFRGLQWVVFEPNDAPLWGQMRLAAGSFMQNLFRQGAFQGQTPREAYLVKCDAETTTQADIDLGIVNILIGFAPLKPAEFVIVSLRLLAGQAES
jgi:uncharacterized protein